MGRKEDSGGRHISFERQRKFSDPVHSSFTYEETEARDAFSQPSNFL